MNHYVGERVWIWSSITLKPYRGIITEISNFGCYVWTGNPRDEFQSKFNLWTDKEKLYDEMIQHSMDLERYAKEFRDSEL